MKIFETDRLIIRNLRETDADDYFDMMGNPNVMSLIPREVMSREESDKLLNNFIAKDQTLTDTKVWGIETKKNYLHSERRRAIARYRQLKRTNTSC